MQPERQWYYAIAGQKAGPIPESELLRLRGAGVINGRSLVWTEGWPEWRALGGVDGLPVPPPGIPPVPPPATAGTPADTSGMATSALVFGVLGLSGLLCCATGPLSVIAVVLGHMVLAKPGLDPHSKQLATIGLALGYLGLLFMLLPMAFGLFWGGWWNHLPEVFHKFHQGVGI